MRKLTILLATLFSYTISFPQNNIYVDSAANGANDGSSWQNAYTNLDSALLHADLSTDSILIAKGTYRPSVFPANTSSVNPRDKAFQIIATTTIVGGYSSGGIQFDPKNFAIVLSGDIGLANDLSDNVYHVLIAREAYPKIYGVIIEGGNANGADSLHVGSYRIPRNEGGAGYFESTQIVFENVIIRNNYGYRGGGILSSNSDLDMNALVFSENRAYRGGGVYSHGTSSIRVINAVYYKNFAEHAGGAFLNRSISGFSFDHSTFVENGAGSRGGAIFNAVVNPNRIANCLFTKNFLQTSGNIIEDGVDIMDSLAVSVIRNCLMQLKKSCNTCIFTQTAQLTKADDGDGDDNIWMSADDGLRLSPSSDAFKSGKFGYSLKDILLMTRSGDSVFDIGAYESNPIANYSSTTIYVDSAASGLNNGSNWANAYTSLQDAINVAAYFDTSVDTIKIAKGSYKPSTLPRGLSFIEMGSDYSKDRTFHIPGNVSLIGGYSSGGGEYNPKTNETILLADNYHIITISNVSNIVLDGLIVKGGNSNGAGNIYVGGIEHARNVGAGILIVNANATIKNCQLINNRTSSFGGGISSKNSFIAITDSHFAGNYGGTGAGAINVERALPGSRIRRSTFDQNLSWQFGGAFRIHDNADPFLIDSCSFTNNQATVTGGDGGGGAIFCSHAANLKLTNCFFENNRGYNGGALQAFGTSIALIKNSVFRKNIATGYGGAVNTSNYGTTLVNSLFIENTCTNQGGSVSIRGNSVVDNCLFYKNAAPYGGGAIMHPHSQLYLRNNLFYGNMLVDNPNIGGADLSSSGSLYPFHNSFQTYVRDNVSLGNLLGAPPLFKDTTDFDGPDNLWRTSDDGLSLQFHSPLINEGKAVIDYETADMDVTGGARVHERYSDIGPYESNNCTLLPIINKTVYVDSSAQGNNTGRDWTNALTDLESAFKLKDCGCGVDTIKIAKGTYYPNSVGRIIKYVVGTSGTDYIFHFPDSLVVLGGYPAGGGVRDYKTNHSILSGLVTGESYRNRANVSFINNVKDLLIDGLVFQEGGFGPGSPNRVIEGTVFLRDWGKGFYAVNSDLNVRNCIFRYNSSGQGALYLLNCTGTILNSVIEKNTCLTSAGAISENSNVKFAGCIFSGNSSPFNGANALYVNLYGTPPSVYNCTFINNNNSFNSPAVAGEFSQQTPLIANSVFWGNTSDIRVFEANLNKISHSLFQHFQGRNNSIVGIDPEFVDISDPDGPDDFWGTADDGIRLKNTSPAINRGHNDSIPSKLISDVAGNQRINGGVVDMGAYECNCFPPSFTTRLVPRGNIENSNSNTAECGRWDFGKSSIDASKYIIEVYKNGNLFSPSSITIDASTNQNHQRINGTESTTLAYRMVSINAPGSYTVNGGLRLRIYFDSTELNEMYGNYRTWFKHPGANKTAVLNDLTFNRLQNAIPITPVSWGKIDGNSYVEFEGITTFSTFGYLTSSSTSGVLPVNFVSFIASRIGGSNNVLLTWKTEQEQNNQEYLIERSKNSVDWITVGKVEPNRTSTAVKEYSFTDVSVTEPISFYRIKQVDFSGNLSFSQVRMVQFSNTAPNFTIRPNPANHYVEIRDFGSPTLSYKIVNTLGGLVLQGHENARNNISISTAHLPPGTYWVIVNGQTGKFVIQR